MTAAVQMGARVAGWLLLFALLTVLGAAAEAFAQVADSAGPGGPVSGLGTVLIGLGAALATAGVRHVGTRADRALGHLDHKITGAIGPGLPFVAAGLAALLPLLSNAVGLSAVPSADAIANAPTSAIVGIAARELMVRLFPKLRGR